MPVVSNIDDRAQSISVCENSTSMLGIYRISTWKSRYARGAGKTKPSEDTDPF